jgi:hypothetical protein
MRNRPYCWARWLISPLGEGTASGGGRGTGVEPSPRSPAQFQAMERKAAERPDVDNRPVPAQPISCLSSWRSASDRRQTPSGVLGRDAAPNPEQ